jgi:hypothetical protein
MRIKATRKFTLISLVSVLVLAAIIGSSFFFVKRHNSSADIPEGIAGRSEINYGPPTEEEKAAGDAQKDKTIEQQQLDDSQTRNSTANIVITDASYYPDDSTVEVRAYISNIIEDGGTCTAKFTQGSQTITKTSQAFKDASTTQCGSINVSRSEFTSAGTWNVTLTYESSAATGQQTTTIKL